MQSVYFIFQWNVKCKITLGKSDLFSEINHSHMRKSFYKIIITGIYFNPLVRDVH